MRRKHWLAAVGAVVALDVMRGAAAQGLIWEYPKIPSLTLTDEQFLRGDKEAGVPVDLTAVLQLPEGTKGPLPAVALLHGSGGYGSGSVDSWAETFNALGIATLALDSFGGRGIIRTTPTKRSSASWRWSTTPTAAWNSWPPIRGSTRAGSQSWASPAAAVRCSVQPCFGSSACTVQVNARIAAYLPFYPCLQPRPRR